MTTLGLKPDVRIEKGDDHHFQLSLLPWTHGDEFRSVSRLIGKLTLPCPGPLEWEDPYAEKHESYAAFITGSDSEGKPIRQSCKPQENRNRAPSFLTPVFFRRQVLQKYFNEPERYTVGDGCLSCGGLWSLRFDNDHPHHAGAWLGDLGYLSATEQAHWKGFDIMPDGSFSKMFISRNVRAWPADSTMPDLVFKNLYPRINLAGALWMATLESAAP